MLTVHFLTKESRKIISREVPTWASKTMSDIEYMFQDYAGNLEITVILQLSQQAMKNNNSVIGQAFAHRFEIKLYGFAFRKWIITPNGLWRNQWGQITQPTNEYNYDYLRHTLSHEFGHFYNQRVNRDWRVGSKQVEIFCDDFAEMITGVTNPEYRSDLTSSCYPNP